MPVFLLLSCTEAKRGPCQLCRRRKITPSTNEEVLRRTGLTLCTPPSASAGFADLVMSDQRILKALLYSELVVGKRNVGRSRLRYKDVCKRDVKSLKNVNIDEWERLTDDHNKWRSLIMERLCVRENLVFRI